MSTASSLNKGAKWVLACCFVSHSLATPPMPHDGRAKLGHQEVCAI